MRDGATGADAPKRLSAEDWKLYTSSMDCTAAAEAINDAIEGARAAGRDRAGVAEAAWREMERHADHGAADSEPRGVLADLLDGMFANGRFDQGA